MRMLMLTLGIVIAGLAGAANAHLAVDVAIKPDRDPNSVNPFSKGKIPVAVLGSAGFDVSTVDVTTLAFGPGGAAPTNKAGGQLGDVNDDSYLDLLSHYRTQETGIAPGETQACVTGETLDGMLFEGCDEMRTVPDPKCGLGFEAALLLAPLMALRRKRVG